MKDAVQTPSLLPSVREVDGIEDLAIPASYARLRDRLIRIFARRGCSSPEDLADETISRVLARWPQIAATFEGDPIRYLHGVARNVFREHKRTPKTVSIEDVAELRDTRDAEGSSPGDEAHRCLERCLSELTPSDRRLIREYYRYDKQAKIDRRKDLADEAGIPMNTLRIKAYRIRRRLSACVHDCANGASDE
jgi:DNA-directed RNA polymerase specialized sigma24 family protein